MSADPSSDSSVRSRSHFCSKPPVYSWAKPPYSSSPVRLAAISFGMKTRSGPSASPSASTPYAIAAFRNDVIVPPPYWIHWTPRAAIDAETGTRNAPNTMWISPRNPRPPAPSGCVGTRRRSSRETRPRKTDQSPMRHSQRNTRKLKIGRLTKSSQRPASVMVAATPGTRVCQFDAGSPSARVPTRPSTKAPMSMTVSGTTESRARSSLAIAASSSDRAGPTTSPEIRNCWIASARRSPMLLSAATSSGTPSRNRVYAVTSYSSGRATWLP